MKKRIFAVAAALCLLAGTGAFAQDSKKAPMMKERPTAEQMAQRILELEAQLKQEQMRSAVLETMIDLAESDLKISIRKKSGAKQSK